MENIKNEVKIMCVNDGKRHIATVGMTLAEASAKWCPKVKDPKTGHSHIVLAALVDNKLKELSYRIEIPCKIEFVSYANPDGRGCYNRSLSFVLQSVVREMYPDKVMVADHSLPSGLYFEIHEDKVLDNGRHPVHFVTDAELEEIRERMQKLIEKDLPFKKEKMPSEEAVEIFKNNKQPLKAELLQSLGRFSTSVYSLGKEKDTFYGPLVPSTGYLSVFGLTGFSNGFCLQFPQIYDPTKLMATTRQSKIASALKEYSDWCEVIGVNGVGTLNKKILDGHAVELINMSEILHERKYAAIADDIFRQRDRIRIVMIAGPSSSGKTSSSLRIALQLKVLGLNPKVIELDNYFVDREFTPVDENGKLDFENLNAMNLDLLNQQLNALLAGEEIELPKYDFKEGKRKPSGKMMRLEDKDILIMEGIHALNPQMTSAVDNTKIFRVYASALTSLQLDENNTISTSDNRLLRRMVRDNRVRGYSPEKTILQWHSVRRGESKNIFPFQENADALFNSALLFELPMLKYYAMPLLMRIQPSSPAYAEAVRLMKFLGYITALQPSEIEAIPPTSIMREFIGGQSLGLD